MYQTERSKRLKVGGPEIRKWTVQTDGTGRSKEMKMDSLNYGTHGPSTFTPLDRPL